MMIASITFPEMWELVAERIDKAVDKLGRDNPGLLSELEKALVAGHEETARSLENPATYSAFVASLKPEDLRGVGVDEECVEDFREANQEEREWLVELMDIYSVYQLFERKQAENAFVDPGRATAPRRGYNGHERLAQQILKLATADAPGTLQGLQTLQRSPLADSWEERKARKSEGTSEEAIEIKVELTD